MALRRSELDLTKARLARNQERMTETVASRDSVIAQLEGELQRSKEQCSQSSLEVASLHSQLEIAQHELEDHGEQRSKDLEAVLANLAAKNQQINELKQEMGSKKEEYDAMESTRLLLENKIGELQAQMASERESHSSIMAKREEVMQGLRTEFAETKKRADRMQQDLANNRKELENALSDLASSQRNTEVERQKMALAVHLRSSENDTLNALMATRVQELSVAHDRITQLSTEIVTANNAAAHSSEQLLKFEAMYETLAKQKVDLQAEVASLEGALLQRKEALTAAQSQLQHEQSTFEALRKRHDISLSQLAAAAAERENLIRGIKKLQTLLEEAKHEEERLTTEIDGLNLKASHLQEQALDAQKEFKATIKELEENISRLDKAKVKSDKVVENIENERDLMQMDLIRIQKDNEELRQQAAQASATYKMSLGTLTTALEQERKRFDEERGNVAKVQNAGREKLKHVYDRHDQLTQQLQQRYEQLVRRLSHPHRLRITCRIVPHSLIGSRANQFNSIHSGGGDGVG